jgi:hypothetical protein
MASSSCIQRRVFSSSCKYSSWLSLAVTGIELGFQSTFCILECLQELRGNGKQIAARQTDNLVHIAKACSHDLRLVAEFLVVSYKCVSRIATPGSCSGAVSVPPCSRLYQS